MNFFFYFSPLFDKKKTKIMCGKGDSINKIKSSKLKIKKILGGYYLTFILFLFFKSPIKISKIKYVIKRFRE